MACLLDLCSPGSTLDMQLLAAKEKRTCSDGEMVSVPEPKPLVTASDVLDWSLCMFHRPSCIRLEETPSVDKVSMD
jgi:hypothetical protein